MFLISATPLQSNPSKLVSCNLKSSGVTIDLVRELTNELISQQRGLLNVDLYRGRYKCPSVGLLYGINVLTTGAYPGSSLGSTASTTSAHYVIGLSIRASPRLTNELTNIGSGGLSGARMLSWLNVSTGGAGPRAGFRARMWARRVARQWGCI
jgi:hypothetical protein